MPTDQMTSSSIQEHRGTMSKTAFFTVTYPAAEPYLRDFLHSLEQQSCGNFELVIFNDGVRHLDLTGCRIATRILDVSGTPAEIRDAGLRFLKERGYELAIFGDSDDFFSQNRVEVCINLLQTNDVVVNDLDLVDEGGQPLLTGYLSQRLCGGDLVAADFIRDKNIFGLSNTAVRISRLPQVKIPAEIVAVDWFIFSTLLEGGGTAVFSAAARTCYRQHGANTAGLSGQGPQMLLQAVKVKTLHYASMAAAGSELYRNLATAFKTLYQRLQEDEAFRVKYLEYLKYKTRDFPFWWENALLPEELPWKYA